MKTQQGHITNIRVYMKILEVLKTITEKITKKWHSFWVSLIAYIKKGSLFQFTKTQSLGSGSMINLRIPKPYLNSTSEYEKLIFTLETFNIKMSKLEDMLVNTYDAFSVYAITNEAIKERDIVINALEDYFKYEKRNGLPADINLRSLYKIFKETTIL